VPHLKALFDLNYTQTMLIQFTFFSAYFLMSIPSSRILARVGYQKSIVLGLVVMGCGALLFYPAAAVKSYALFLGALWVLASGITLLQVAANPYVAQLGSPESASSRLNLAQAFNSLGTTIGPYLGGLLILSATAATADVKTVQLPYIGIAVTLFLLAFGVSRFHLPSLPDIEEHPGTAITDSIWKHRQLILGAIGIFVYVGAEVSIGSFLVNYFRYIDRSLSLGAAAGFVSFYWGGAMVGRFIGSEVLREVSPGKVLGGAALGASALLCATVASTGSVAMWTVIAVGLFNSVMFPTIFTLGIAKLGPLTAKGSSLLIMAIVGGAILPLAQGVLADSIGIHLAFLMPAICYVYIAYFGFSRPTELNLEPASGRERGAKRMIILVGAVIGGLVGFLLRPSVPLIGQLPFGTVITRGSNLSGLDLLLKGAAETSCNYMLVGALIGGAIGWIVMQQTRKAKKQ
jgi:FHS family L-fucose permease-like MFS transporter